MRRNWVQTLKVCLLLFVVSLGAVAAAEVPAAPYDRAGARDCDGDGIIDTSDCNANGIQDECDLTEPALESYFFSPGFGLEIPELANYGFGINVPLRAEVVDLDVALHIDHPFQNDLVITLAHDGTSITLIDRVGSSCSTIYSADNFGSKVEPLVLDDAAGVAIDCYNGNASVGVNGYAGPAQPSEALSAFDGLDASGNWSLIILDEVAGNVGEFWLWRLDMKTLSADCNDNGVPDECELDCDNNNVADECDIRDGTSEDCNSDGVPDVCQLQGNDCNGSGVPDECELIENDCNQNGRPDECDLFGLPGNVAGGILANDCNFNGVPDDCELGANDCNSNGYPDDCDIRGGGRLLSADFENGLPAGWSVQGPMTITGACREDPVCDGSLWAYAGDPQTCSTGDGDQIAVLKTPNFETNFPLATLRLCSRLGDSGGGGKAVLRHDCEFSSWSQNLEPVADGEWHEMEVELGNEVAARGACHLEFQLESSGPFLGWQIDAIELVSGSADKDGNGVPDECEADCNNNNTPDLEDISNGTSEDCNTNGVPDECELADDCNDNQTPDACDISSGLSQDCNGGGVPDECEIADHPEIDCNQNGAIDGCELQAEPGADCNANELLDTCEIADGTQFDCNENGILDVCDLAPPTATDDCERASLICPGTMYTGSTTDASPDGTASCGSSGQSPDKWLRYLPTESGQANVSLCGSEYDTVLSLRDSCPSDDSIEIACNDDDCASQSTVFFDAVAGQTYWIRISGYDGGETGTFQLTLNGPPCGGIVLDCNQNGVPDSCDAVGNDRNNNGVPDDCEACPGADITLDSDGDGVPDDCDACPGFDDTLDADGDGVPDDCDVCAGFDDTVDQDADGIPDGCDLCPQHELNECGDLVALWRFENEADPQPDETPFGNDAALAGDVTWVLDADPDRGGVMVFDGDDDYLEAADSLSLSIAGDMTVMAWVHVSDFAGWRGIVSKSAGNLPAPYDFYLFPNTGIPQLYRGDGGVYAFVAGSIPPATGEWVHVAATMAGTTVTHYLNGVPNGSAVLSTPVADANGPLRIGSRDDLFLDMLGRMDDVALFRVALTPDQVAVIAADNDADFDGVADDIDNCPNDANGPLSGPDDQLDADADGVGDSCDACPGFDDTLDDNGDGVPDDCETLSLGDFTGDGIVDLDDLPHLGKCLAGPGETSSPYCQSGADFDADGDVDLQDFGGYSVTFNTQP